MKTCKKSNKPTIHRFKTITLVFLSILFLVSCQKRDNSNEDEVQSAVNVVNATIGLRPIGFFINKAKVQGNGLSYTDESGYFITFPGTRDFDAMEEGSSDYFLKTNLTFKLNTYHTIFIAGESSSITTLLTDDDLSSPPAGKAKIRFVHLSPDGGSLVLAIKNGAALFPEQVYKTASQFTTLAAGVYDLQVKTATGTIILERNVTVTPGAIYTAWVKGMKLGTANSPIGLQFRAIN